METGPRQEEGKWPDRSLFARGPRGPRLGAGNVTPTLTGLQWFWCRAADYFQAPHSATWTLDEGWSRSGGLDRCRQLPGMVQARGL